MIKHRRQQQKILTGYYLAAGAGGIATAVHSTQFEIRLPQYNLFERVLRTVAGVIDEYEAKTGRVIVRVAGVCGKTEQAVREARLAKRYGYDAVLLSEFDSLEDVERYKNDPRHVAVSSLCKSIRTARGAVDFEI